jgi:AAA ATPase domain
MAPGNMTRIAKNPFKPTFGVSPPLLVGRDVLLDDFSIGLDDDPGHPSRATIYTGSRGIGKTVLLNEVERAAQARGWLVIAETARDGLVSRFVQEHLPKYLTEHADNATKTRLTGLGLFGGNAAWTTSDTYTVTAGMRTLLDELLIALARNDAGVLITVDELRPEVRELEEMLTVLQHTFREEREIAFAGAGLPGPVDQLVKQPGMTFLQRAATEHLSDVPLADVADAIRKPIEAAGRKISSAALDEAARATDGYPFLIQLVGYYSWNQNLTALEVSPQDVERGALQAQRRVGSLVHGPVVKDCSPVAISYLLAMAIDDGPSRTADVAERIKATAGYGSQYRQQLITAGLIKPTSHGFIDFALPGLREYMRDHAAILSIQP